MRSGKAWTPGDERALYPSLVPLVCTGSDKQQMKKINRIRTKEREKDQINVTVVDILFGHSL